MKYFMTDIHGDFRGMQLLLKYADLDYTKDQLVFGGDMIDRGNESAEVVREIYSLVQRYPKNVHAIIGNHEEMMAEYYKRQDTLWLRHGGHESIQSFNTVFSDESERKRHIAWACSLPLSFEDGEFFYTHAGMNPNELLEKQSREILWLSESDFYGIPKERLLALTKGKPIIHGHTPVENLIFDGGRLNCDLGSNTYIVEEERGLGLVNLSAMTYLVYRQKEKKIEEREILRY